MNFSELRGLASGFQPAALFIKCLEAGVFDALGDGGLTAGELAEKASLNTRAAKIAADGLTALGLLIKKGDRYFNTPEADSWLVKTSPDYRGSILLHLGASWEDYADLDETLKTGSARCKRKEGAVPAKAGELENFILGMENMTREAAPLLAGKLPLSSRKSILDLGAGPGNYCLAFAASAPEAKVHHFDLPGPSAVARKFTAGKPGADRITFMVGDFLNDPIGEGYDFIWLSQVIHMVSEAEAQALLKKAATALVPGGILAIHDHFLDDSMTSPLSAALFSVHMLTVTPGGRGYSFSEVEGWMREAGLGDFERIEYSAPSRVCLGRKG